MTAMGPSLRFISLLVISITAFANADPTVYTCESGRDIVVRNIMTDSTFVRESGGIRTNCLYDIRRPDESTCGIYIKINARNLNHTRAQERIQVIGYDEDIASPQFYEGTTESLPFSISSNRISLLFNVTQGSYNLSFRYAKNCFESQELEPGVSPIYSCGRDHREVRIDDVPTSLERTYIEVKLTALPEAPICKFIFTKRINNSCGQLSFLWDTQNGIHGNDVGKSSMVMTGAQESDAFKSLLLFGNNLPATDRISQDYHYLDDLSIEVNANELDTFILPISIYTSFEKCIKDPPSSEVITCSSGQHFILTGDMTIGSSPDVSECTFKFLTIPDSNQIRIEFIDLNLSPPNMSSYTQCQESYISVFNREVFDRGGRPLTFCGDQKPAHNLYLTFKDGKYSNYYRDSLGHGGIDFVTKLAPGNTFKIKISYIKNDSPDRAPDNCVIMLPPDTGVFKSFGYSKYMLRQTYKACVNQSQDFLRWSECDSETIGNGASPFDLSVYYSNTNRTVKIGAAGASCKWTNYIQLRGDLPRCGSSFTHSFLTIPRWPDQSASEIDVNMGDEEDAIVDGQTLVLENPKRLPCPEETIGFNKCRVAADYEIQDYCVCRGKRSFERPVITSPNIGFCLQYRRS